ncbi:MAG: M23 family metallopeptidase [Myxococcota bacterium]
MRNASPGVLSMSLGVLSMSLTLACVHEGNPRPDDARVPPPLETGKPPAQATPACGDSTDSGSKLAFDWPANGKVTSGFGMRRGKAHRGIDIAGYRGKTVRAAAAGTVIFSGQKGDYGRVVILKHAGSYKTVYAHNMDTFVLEGAEVEPGQPIADMGATGNSTGPHLHFEVRIEDRALDPLACLPIRTPTRR